MCCHIVGTWTAKILELDFREGQLTVNEERLALGKDPCEAREKVICIHVFV
jgi:hypothetical protein